MNKIFFIGLLITLILACQIEPYHPKTHGKAHREFTLEFQYACRKGLEYDSCQGDVFWNNQMIQAVAPKDHKIHTKVIKVYVNVGDNFLKFVGTGTSDKKGLTIDNVKLIREGTKINIAVNGNFEKPNLNKGWKIFDKIPGWVGQGIEVGSGTLYNKNWKSQVVELDAAKNGHLTQKWKFDSNYFLIRSKKSQNAEKDNKPTKAIQEENDIILDQPEIVVSDTPEEPSDIVEQTPSSMPDQATPEVISGEPAIISDQPAIVSDEPAITSDQPSVVSGEPAFRSDEGAIVTDQPEAVSDQPTIVSDTPAVVSGEPAFEEPPIFNDQPGIIVDESPITPAAQPVSKPNPTVKPAVLVAQASKKSYTLKFQYACRKKIDFASCQGNVFWNGKKIVHIVPTDHLVHSKIYHVQVEEGQNVLKFQGTGRKDSFGLTIDNVQLIQEVSKKDIVVNGGFEKPNMNKKWKIADSIPGWKGKDIQVGWGKIYNKGWKSQVVQLDGKKNVKGYFEQKWNFNSNYELIQDFVPDFMVDQPAVVDQSMVKPAVMPTVQSAVSPTLTVQNPTSKKYNLSFKYACRKNIAFDSCKGNVYWNGVKVVHIIPVDHDVHHYPNDKPLQVAVVPGENVLKFQGAGTQDTFGLTIDDVTLVEEGKSSSIVVNGGFEKPDLGKGWKVFDKIPGWNGKGIEVGYGKIYNKGWESQVVELDGHDHGYLSQKWNFDDALALQK